jgi:hypothetical protein
MKHSYLSISKCIVLLFNLAILFIVSIYFSACNHPDKNTNEGPDLINEKAVYSDSLLLVFDDWMEIQIELPQLIDSSFFSPECLAQFNELARSTGGEMKVVAKVNYVVRTIIDIIKNNCQDHTDIMIILDKTSSMADDMEYVKKGLEQIFSEINNFQQVRLSVATYGDINIDGKLWYDFQNFEYDFEKTQNFIQKIKLTDGGDFPESVYDGIYEAFQENFWQSQSKRIVILLGDAPSLAPPLSTYTEKDIIALATKEKINMNFYPIVLSPYDLELEEFEIMENKPFITAIYPNPTTGIFTIQFNENKSYLVEIFNQNGELIQTEKNSYGFS